MANRRISHFAVVLGLALLTPAAPPVHAAAAVPTPTIVGPITSPGSAFIAGTTFDLTPLDYVEEEFFVSGTASAFTSAAPLGSDGRWTATPGETAAYTTRVLVHRPASRRRFNGTVIVEWLNVSGGVDAAPDWIIHPQLPHAGGLRLGRRVGAVRRRRGRRRAARPQSVAQGGQPGALRAPPTSRRQLLVRHVLSGGAGAPDGAGHAARRRSFRNGSSPLASRSRRSGW